MRPPTANGSGTRGSHAGSSRPKCVTRQRSSGRLSSPAEWPRETISRITSGRSRLWVLFRDDVQSNRISFRETDWSRFFDELRAVGAAGDAYIVTAMDA